MKTKKTLCTLIAILFTVTLCAGCQGGGSTSGGNATNTSASTEAVTESTTTAATTAAAADANSGDADSPKGKITVSGHDDAFGLYTAHFLKKYPDVEVEFVIIPDTDVKPKLMASLSAGVAPPDVLYLSNSLWIELVELPIFENLSQAPYNADEWLSKQYPALQEVSKNSKGEIMGLTMQACPVGYHYKRDLAKKYLGTDDPAEIGNIFSSWESIFDTGEKVYEESGGTTYLLSCNQDIVYMQMPFTDDKWIRDGKLYLNKAIYDIFDVSLEGRVKNTEAKLGAWSPEWFNGLFDPADENFIGCICATWLMPYNQMVNAPETKGNWGLATALKPSFWGGTWAAMAVESKVKDLAWLYLQHCTSDPEFLDYFVSEMGDFCSNEEVNLRIAASNPPAYEWWGGQDVYSLFSDIAAEASQRLYVYQFDVENSLTTYINEVINNDMPIEQAKEEFKTDIKSKLPEIEIIEE